MVSKRKMRFNASLEVSQMVRPPGFEPGTRGWKPLVITPSLQARGLGEHTLSLNRFGQGEVLTSYLKSNGVLGSTCF